MYQLVHGNRFSAFTENVSMRGECICGSQPSTSFALLFAPPKLKVACVPCSAKLQRLAAPELKVASATLVYDGRSVRLDHRGRTLLGAVSPIVELVVQQCTSPGRCYIGAARARAYRPALWVLTPRAGASRWTVQGAERKAPAARAGGARGRAQRAARQSAACARARAGAAEAEHRAAKQREAACRRHACKQLACVQVVEARARAWARRSRRRARHRAR